MSTHSDVGPFGLPERKSDEKVSRRQFIAEQVYDNWAREGKKIGLIEIFMCRTGIIQIEEAHPEWDFDLDLRTRDEWLHSKDVI